MPPLSELQYGYRGDAREVDTHISRLMLESKAVARKFLVSGEVQGVGYRYFAMRAAARHQVLGYVKNLEDGRVESLAEGSEKSVEEFKHDLLAGPSFGRVEHLEEIVVDPSGLYSNFRIER